MYNNNNNKDNNCGLSMLVWNRTKLIFWGLVMWD